MQIITGHDDIVSSLAVDNSNHDIFYSSSWDGYVFQYSIAEGLGELITEVEGHNGIIHDIAHSSMKQGY